MMDKSNDLIQFTKDRPGHDFRYSLNTKKIRRQLRWKLSHKFKDGLKLTIEWYAKNENWYKYISTKNMLQVSWKTR